jgi:two-component system phosphate regulon sensor histidine kinase PhoR
LKAEQRVIGVLEAINKHNGRFDENDSRLLQAISGPLAIALENALLHLDVLSEKRRIETIFASMSDGLMTTNAKGDITAANEALVSLLDVTLNEIIGEGVATAIKTQPGGFFEFFQEVLQEGPDFPQLACDIVRKDGEYVPVLVSGTKINKEDGSVSEVIFVFSDLGQIRELERMRDDFFNNIVHELRTPLATILMYARLLREGKAIDDPARSNRFLGVIERESDRLQKMVKQMLQLAKLESNTHQELSESTNINYLLEQILPPLADRAREKGLVFNEVIQPKLPAVRGSEETLYMIVKNVIENGIKFTPAGSVSVEAWLQKSSVLIEVTDEGIGITKEALPNLFQRFYRTKSAVERGIAGTGLGLYMVKEGLEINGGAIEVSSHEDKGSRFTVSLPVADE